MLLFLDEKSVSDIWKMFAKMHASVCLGFFFSFIISFFPADFLFFSKTVNKTRLMRTFYVLFVQFKTLKDVSVSQDPHMYTRKFPLIFKKSLRNFTRIFRDGVLKKIVHSP